MMLTKFILLLELVSLTVAGCTSPQAQPDGMTFPPVPASTAPVMDEMMPIEIRVVGNVEPFSSVEVKSQVAGPLVNVRFAEGGNVGKGDLLFEIDPRPYREALRQAEAAVTKDQAQLRLAEANLARGRAQLKNAEADADRYEALVKEGLSTKMQQEQIRTTAQMVQQAVRADEAAIESIAASLESTRAAVDRAKLDLSYCEIRSPIGGRAGNLLLHIGNLVKANGDSPLVVINQVRPIFVTFGVPERYLAAITKRSAGRKLPVQASIEKTLDRSARGTLSVIDNTVDPNTGTIRLKATFDNGEGALWPGQFVNVVLTLDTQMATVIPAEAVQAGQQGPFVYVVKADQTVEPRPVTAGQNVAGKIIVEKGLTAGETVVTDGQSRLFPGAKIQTPPSGKPEPEKK